MTFKNALHRYYADKSGHFAVSFAIMGLPLLLGISVAIDSQKMHAERDRLKSALDGAAIAAITHQTLTVSERTKYAEERFWLNIANPDGISVKVRRAENHRVEIEAEMKIPTLFQGIIGRDDVKFNASAASELVKGATVCMLALDKDSPRSFEVTEGATLDANCSIQVNSLHKKAAVIDMGGKAAAQSFCVAGGAYGKYHPYVNTECSVATDPYKAVEIPHPGRCIDQNVLKEKLSDWRAERDAIENHEIEENERWALANREGRIWYPTYFEKPHLQPGNYCEGLFLEGKEFILDPGVYHISDGTIVFGLGTELIGKDVTFVLHDDAKLEIRDGSILNLKGPSKGPLKGLVIAQNIGNYSVDSPNLPNATSTITDGAMLNLLGTVYLPTHKIEFLGGSLAETRAPATSFIAHQISIRDGADIGVATDHRAANIPPIVPRSDDTARLVQ